MMEYYNREKGPDRQTDNTEVRTSTLGADALHEGMSEWCTRCISALSINTPNEVLSIYQSLPFRSAERERGTAHALLTGHKSNADCSTQPVSGGAVKERSLGFNFFADPQTDFSLIYVQLFFAVLMLLLLLLVVFSWVASRFAVALGHSIGILSVDVTHNVRTVQFNVHVSSVGRRIDLSEPVTTLCETRKMEHILKENSFSRSKIFQWRFTEAYD